LKLLFKLVRRLTELLVSSYSGLAIEKQRNIITKYNVSFIKHLFTSRVRFGNNLHKALANHFLDVFSNFDNDQSVLNSEIENYWLAAKEKDSIYNKFYPIEMSEHLNWIEHRDWPRATPAVVKFVLNRLPNINETQTSWTDNGITGPRSLLGTAAAAGANIALIKMIVEAGADLNFTQSAPMSFRGYEFSIIHCAVAGSNFDVVKYRAGNDTLIGGAGAERLIKPSKANAAIDHPRRALKCPGRCSPKASTPTIFSQILVT
jgi:hypothetical protein